MSLTTFIKIKEVKCMLGQIRPKIPRSIDTELLVECSGGRPNTVGTSFDYLLRFELMRRTGSAKQRPWVAESALHFLELTKIDSPNRWPHLETDYGKTYQFAELIERVQIVIANANNDISRFIKKKIPHKLTSK